MRWFILKEVKEFFYPVPDDVCGNTTIQLQQSNPENVTCDAVSVSVFCEIRIICKKQKLKQNVKVHVILCVVVLKKRKDAFTIQFHMVDHLCINELSIHKLSCLLRTAHDLHSMRA